MKLEIKIRPALVRKIDTTEVCDDIKKWLEKQAANFALKWLLAHADDGVIWGRIDNGTLITSSEVDEACDISPPLRIETLQQARLFAPHGEILLWRDGDGNWNARLIRDAEGGEKVDWEEVVDEAQILWGTDGRVLSKGFTLMSDGGQGLRHVVPIEVYTKPGDRNRPLRLWVRHYIGEDGEGYARIVASRLMDIGTASGKSWGEKR